MEYRIIREDELYHYGVPGMRWGHRKAQTSLAGTGHRALAGVYGMNQRFYNKTGNRTAASINAQARNQQLKKAEAADRAKANKSKARAGEKMAKRQAVKNAKVSYKEAKAKSNAARKAYNKSFNRAYNFSSRHAITQYIKKSKNYQKSNDNWADAMNKAEAYNSAHKEMRAARKAYRSARRG